LAYVFEHEDGSSDEISFGSLWDEVRACASGLQSQFDPGDRVILLFPAGLDYIVAFLGVLAADLVAVPAYPPSGSRHSKRLRPIVEDAQPRLILADAGLLSDDRLKALCAGLDGIRLESINSVRGAPEQWHRGPQYELAFLQYTSGSTGTPKGVMVTHANLVANEKMIADLFGHGPDTRVAGWLPFYHDMGLIGNILQPLYLGVPCFLMSPASFAREPLRWLRLISKHRVTTSGAPNFAYDLCAQAVSSHDGSLELDLSAWKVAFNGSEPVRAATMRRFAQVFEPYKFSELSFLPCYGLAEGTLIVTAAHEALAGGDASCGWPAKGLEVQIVDPETRAVRKTGEEGEIWVSGASVAKGYWGRDDLTSRTFNAELQPPEAGKKFLRTGDLGRFSQRGLIVTGRIKDLIIVRGRNIHPQDVEAIAAECAPGLRKGGSAAFAVDALGSAWVLVQEVERRFDGELSQLLSTIRSAIVAELEVVPDRILLVRSHSVPNTTSGKVQRAVCRELYCKGELPILAQSGTGDEASEGLEGPIPTVVEGNSVPAAYQLVASVARIQPEEVDDEKSLIELGMDSIAAVKLQHEIVERWGVQIPIEILLSGSPLAEALSLILDRPEVGAKGIEPPAPNSRTEWQASLGQYALWMLQQKAGNTPLPEIRRLFTITGPLDVGRLLESLNEVVRRHPVLGASLDRDGDELKWRLDRSPQGSLEVIDIRSLGEAGRRAALERCLEAPWDLTTAPLIRAFLLKDEDRHLLLLRAHHIILDLWSFKQIFAEWKEVYEALVSGRPLGDRIAPEFDAFIAGEIERDYLASYLAQRDRDFWSKAMDEAGKGERLAPLPMLAQEKIGSHSAARETFGIRTDLSARLKKLAQSQGLTLNSLLLTSWQLNLWRATGASVTVSFPAFGRNPSTSRSVGYFVNPLPLPAGHAGAQSFLEAAVANQALLFSSLEHQQYPALKIAELDGNGWAFQTAFIFQGASGSGEMLPAPLVLGTTGGSLDFGGAVLASEAIEPGTTELDLSLYAVDSSEGIQASIEYRSASFDEVFIQGLVAQWRVILERVAAHPQTSVEEFLAAAGAPAVDGQALEPERAVTGCPIHAFETVVGKFTHSIALRRGDETLSYGELNERANRIANSLLERGFERETRIAVLLDRSFDLIAAILGILKAGCCYVPMDTGSAPERLQWIVGSSKAALVIAEEHFAQLVADTGTEHASAHALADSAVHSRNPKGRREDGLAAYLIFTSGSTGYPKGVLVERAGIVNLAAAQIESFQLDETSQTLQFASPAFDASVSEIWTALLSGGSLRLVESANDLLPISDFDFDGVQTGLNRILADGVTTATLPPSVLQQLDPARYPTLKTVVVAGERCPDGLIARWITSHRVINAYGPTEATVCATMLVHDAGRRDPQAVSGARIGFPIQGSRVFAVNKASGILPPGLPGELCLSGIGLARGYFEDPALTAEKFVQAGSGDHVRRAYRTGDLGRVLPGGEVEFFGRIDRQVKIRGVRIELEEVENVIINRLPAVKEAAVIVAEQPNVGNVLVAFIADGSPIDSTTMTLADPLAFKTELTRWLLPQSVPSLFFRLGALPKTQNGKIDINSLRSIDLSQFTYPKPLRLPSNTMEKRIADIWKNVLQVDDVDVQANALDFGGNSLNIATVHSHLSRELGIDIPLVSLFEHSTVEALAKHCSLLLSKETASTEPQRPPGTGALSAQDRARAGVSRRVPNRR
jgi:amino acid adenylation domain-containing protein